MIGAIKIGQTSRQNLTFFLFINTSGSMAISFGSYFSLSLPVQPEALVHLCIPSHDRAGQLYSIKSHALKLPTGSPGESEGTRLLWTRQQDSVNCGHCLVQQISCREQWPHFIRNARRSEPSSQAKARCKTSGSWRRQQWAQIICPVVPWRLKIHKQQENIRAFVRLRLACLPPLLSSSTLVARESVRCCPCSLADERHCTSLAHHLKGRPAALNSIQMQ